MILVLDNLRSIYNVGSIFRTADAFGVEKLLLTGTTPHPHPEEPWRKDHLALIKTALGAENTVPWEYAPSALPVLETLKAHGRTILALEIDPEGIPLETLPPQKTPVVLVIGNEVTGVHKEILQIATTIVTIPMQGTKESLNVAVATGIALYALTK